MTNAVIVSISSDIGAALAERWLGRGWRVTGTVRTATATTAALAARGAELIDCDLASRDSVVRACEAMRSRGPWDVLVLGAGTLEPVGPFLDNDPDAWEESVTVNFTRQVRIVRELLPRRNTSFDGGPCVLFFAGGGTNGAPLNSSAYTVSKIASIKMCELLDAEIPDTRFVILGPGWVKTKIHEQTLAAGDRAGANLPETQRRLRSGDFVTMESVVDCCDWAVQAPRSIVSGRNFSVANDAWRDDALARALVADPNMYKLRRAGNEVVKTR